MRFVHFAIAFAVILLLLLLAFPALVAQREAMRRQQCAMNLSEIGRAFHNYHDICRVLPPIARGKALGLWIPAEGGPQSTDPNAVNWTVLVLPYLDEEDASFRLHESGSPPFDSRRYGKQTARFSCPSDSFNNRTNLYAGLYPRGNYAIDAGSNDICFRPGTQDDLCPNGARFIRDETTGEEIWYGDGVAGYNKSFRQNEFPGGLGQIVAIDEIRAGIHESDSRGVCALGMVGSSVTHQHGLYGDAGSPNNQWLNSDDVYGCKEASQAMGHQKLLNERMPCAAHIVRPRQATARSCHPGGVQCLTLDGACHFIADDVSVDVWHLMHSRENHPSSEPPWDAAPKSAEPTSTIAQASWTGPRDEQPSDDSRELINSVGMRFVRVPAGEYWMGVPDPGVIDRTLVPRHYVCITKDLWLAIRETSAAEFQRVLVDDRRAENRDQRATDNIHDGEPLAAQVNIDWNDAVEFCRRLSQLPAEVQARRSYRLPTEAEWEYACRAGLSREELLTQRNPNSFGLTNMRSDAWEWCSDWYAQDYYARSPLDDPQGPATGVLRVIRGTPWVHSRNAVCWQNRFPMPPTNKSPFVGFRVIAELHQPNERNSKLDAMQTMN